MRKEIREEVNSSQSLGEVRDNLFRVFENYRSAGNKSIGYVAGVVTSDGSDKIAENIKKLDENTAKLRSEQDFPIFSSSDVFSNELFERLDAAGFLNDDWMVFWREVLGSEKNYITDIFMTPGWERSKGAKDEYETALEKGIRIHIVKE